MEVYVITTRQSYSTAGEGGAVPPDRLGSVYAVEGVYGSKPFFDKLAAVCISMENDAIDVLREGGEDVGNVLVRVEEDTDWSRKSVTTCGNFVITTRVDMHKQQLQ